MAGLPKGADVVVVGGGVGGAIIAGRLAAETDATVVLLEAGPDYGRFSDGAWPPRLLNYAAMPVDTHSWSYISASAYGTRQLPLDRARVIGGCSSHNGCAAVWGHRADYDGWASHGNLGWNADALRPLFERASQRLSVHQPPPGELTPWHRAMLESAPGAGFPIIPTLNDFDADFGIAVIEINVANGVRWNSAFAYLDPVRDRENLTIAGDAIVDRVLVDAGRATGVVAIVDGADRRIDARQVVVCGGAYGSPLVLMRSGIGPAEELRAFGIETIVDLPGVGRNLSDHPASRVVVEGAAELDDMMNAFVAAGGIPREEGTTVLAKSSLCGEAFDLHLYPIGHRNDDGTWLFAVYVAVMDPRSVGSVRLSGRGAEDLPIIDHGYFTDPDDADLTVLVEGLEFARGLLSQSPILDLALTEVEPLLTGDALRDYVRRNGFHDYHPVGTCKMGPASDPNAVVDARGGVHGVDGLFVGDASIMPTVPRANTNIPAAVVGERIADLLIEHGGECDDRGR